MTFIFYLDASRSFLVIGGATPCISIDFYTGFKIPNFILTIQSHFCFEVEMERREKRRKKPFTENLFS